MKASTPYKHWRAEDRYDAIVVGSGIGGLASAALLAKHAHKRVLVLERHYVAGGFTHAFKRPGYEWDVGVHYIGDVNRPSMLRRAYDHVTDGALEWADMGEVYDTIHFGEDRYPFRAGRENLRSDLHGWFPRERRAIDRYFDLVRSAVRRSQLYFAEKALPKPLCATLGAVLRWPALGSIRKTTLEVLNSLTRDRRLIGVLAGQWPDYGLPPAQSSFFIHALVAAHYFRGGAYPVGGASRIAETMAPLITREGGAVVTSAEVASIVVERDRAVGVRLADGREIRAPLVISDAGMATTYGRLLAPEHADRSGFTKLRERVKPSCGHASLYLGFRKTARELELPKGNVWVYPGDDHDANVARFLADPEADLPILFLSFPSAKDPTFERRYPGRATMEAVVMLPYEGFERWAGTRWHKRGGDYDTLKARLTERILAATRPLFPKAMGEVDHAELSTPLSTRHFAGHPRGEIYGLDHSPARFESKVLRPRTHLPGLYLTGADVCSAGVSGALMGGVLTASAIMGRNLLGAIAKRHRGESIEHAPAPA